MIGLAGFQMAAAKDPRVKPAKTSHRQVLPARNEKNEKRAKKYKYKKPKYSKKYKKPKNHV